MLRQYTGNVAKAASEATREDASVVYFVDAGDYVVDTVCKGDQLGTRNSVTDRVYGEDKVTGYKWGVVDSVSDPLKNGVHHVEELQQTILGHMR